MGKEIKYDSLDYYKVLGVSPETPEEELRQKYRDMAKFWQKIMTIRLSTSALN